jgi:hypothetical protein
MFPNLRPPSLSPRDGRPRRKSIAKQSFANVTSMPASRTISVIAVICLVMCLIFFCMVRLVKHLRDRQLAEQLALEAARTVPKKMGTPAEIFQSMCHNLTTVNRCDVSPSETCAICLGELQLDVERACAKAVEARPGLAPADSVPDQAEVKSESEETADAVTVMVPPQLDPADPTGDAPDTRNEAAHNIVADGPALQSLMCGHGEAHNIVADGPALQSLMCGHCFHGECIRGWIVHRGAGASCPLCKCDLAVRAPPAAGQDLADRV